MWETEAQVSGNDESDAEKTLSSMDLPEFKLILSLAAQAASVDLEELLSTLTKVLSYEMRQKVPNFEDVVLDVAVKDQFSNRMLVEGKQLAYNVLVIVRGVAFFKSDSMPSVSEVGNIILQTFGGGDLTTYLQGSENEALASTSKSRAFLSSANEEESSPEEPSNDFWMYVLIIIAATAVALLAIVVCIFTCKRRHAKSWREPKPSKADRQIENKKSSAKLLQVPSVNGSKTTSRGKVVEPDVSPDEELNSSEFFSEFWNSKKTDTDMW